MISTSAKKRFKYYFLSERSQHKFKNIRYKMSKGLKSNYSKVHLIYRESKTAGLFSFLYTFLPEFEWAQVNNYTPVVDLCNYPSIFKDVYSSTGLDPWTYLFKPTNSISLREAYSSLNLSNSNSCLQSAKYSLPFSSEWILNSEYIEVKRKIFSTFMQPSEFIQTILDKSYLQYFAPNCRTLGISLRGLCYQNPSVNSTHPIQPTIEQAINQTDALIDEYSISKLYLVCPDVDIINAFKARYGNTLFSYKRPSYSSSSVAKDYFGVISSNESWLDHLSSYLVSVLLLKNCDIVLASLTSSSIFLPLILRNETHLKYFNYGFN